MAETIADCEAEAPQTIIDSINADISSMMLTAHKLSNQIKEDESVLRIKLNIMNELMNSLLTIINSYIDVSEYILQAFQEEIVFYKEELEDF